MIKPDGSGLRQVTRDGSFASGPRFSRDGNVIFYFDSGGNINAMSARGFEPAGQIDRGEWLVACAVPSPATGLITFADTGDSSSYGIFVAKSDGSARRRLPDPGPAIDPGQQNYCSHPVFRRDGKRIVFRLLHWPGGQYKSTKFSLWEVNGEGGNPRQIAGWALFDDPLHWTFARPN